MRTCREPNVLFGTHEHLNRLKKRGCASQSTPAGGSIHKRQINCPSHVEGESADSDSLLCRMIHVNTVRYLDQTQRPRVETSMEGQPPPVLQHHGPGVPPPTAAEQVQGGQGRDVGHTTCASTKAMTETV